MPQHRKRRHQKRSQATSARGRRFAASTPEPTWDQNFAFIADYTEGGAPFGTTWEEYAVTHRETDAMVNLRDQHGLYVQALDKPFLRALTPVNQSPAQRPRRYGPKQCFICGSGRKITTTHCCGLPVCDDWSEFQPYSDPDSCCHRSHDHYTICGYHHSLQHRGDWPSCADCKAAFEATLYHCYATNRFNIPTTDTPSPPACRCDACSQPLSLLADAFWVLHGQILCTACVRAVAEDEDDDDHFGEQDDPEADEDLPPSDDVGQYDDDIPF